MGYLSNESLLVAQAGVFSPLEREIAAAWRVLSTCPVVGYLGFTEVEVRLLGAYREFLSPRSLTGRIDEYWLSIVQGEWYAWIIALHEIYELECFSAMGVNPFDLTQWRENWEPAHLQATVFELHYVRDWARQSGEDVSEIALLLEHPLRKQLPQSHNRDVRAVRHSQGWTVPDEAERQKARRFWSERGKR